VTSGDRWEVLLTAALCALVIGVLGLVAGWLLRRRSLRWQIGLVALVAVASSWAGISAVAQQMLISDHDYAVVSVVSSAAGVISLLVALALGRTLVRWSDSLRAEVRRVGERASYDAGEGVPAGTPAADLVGGLGQEGPAEFRHLAAELGEDWSPGSPTTCARPWPGCGRWPRRSTTAWPTTRRASTARSAPTSTG